MSYTAWREAVLYSLLTPRAADLGFFPVSDTMFRVHQYVHGLELPADRPASLASSPASSRSPGATVSALRTTCAMADCATAVTLTEQMCDVADCYQPLANGSAGDGSHVMCVMDSQMDALELKDLDGGLATNDQRCACLLRPGTNTSRRACPEPPKKVTVSLDLGSPIHTPGARPSQCMADKVDTNWACSLEEGVPSLLTAPSMATHYI